MEGYDDKNTLPYHVAKYFKTERDVCLKTYNAGYTSYSPAIFVPQAKKLLPVVRPDYIVVDVDETDLYDDFARYRKLIVRNERGQNIGVKVSPIGHECSVGLMEARQHALYLTRLRGKALALLCAHAAGDREIPGIGAHPVFLFAISRRRSRAEIFEGAACFQAEPAGTGRCAEGLHRRRQPGAVHLSPASTST